MGQPDDHLLDIVTEYLFVVQSKLCRIDVEPLRDIDAEAIEKLKSVIRGSQS